MKLTHIIATKPPGGATSQPHDDDRSGSSRAVVHFAGRPEREKKSANPFAETRRSILARLNGPPVHVTVEPTWREDLADDWRDFIREVRSSPYSHALVAIGAFFAGLLLIVVPAMIGAGVWS